MRRTYLTWACLALCAGLLAGLSLVGYWTFGLHEAASAQEPKGARSEVRALLSVAIQPPRIMNEAAPAPPSNEQFEAFRENQLTFIKSRVVLMAALRDPKVAELAIVRQATDPMAFAEKKLHAAFLGKSDVMRVEFHAGTPQERATLVNAIVQAYVKEVRQLDAHHQERRLKLLKEIFAEADKKLTEKRRMLRAMSEDLGAIHPPQRQALKEELAMKQVRAIHDELVQLEVELRKALFELSELDRTKGAAAGNPNDKAETRVLAQKGLQKTVERLEAKRTFLTARESRHLSELEAPKRRIDVEWLRDEIMVEDEFAKKLAMQIQLLQIENQAPPRITILEEA